MIAEIIILVFALIFLIISIFLFQGKGTWLIAGYNTLSKEERKKYDEKKCAMLWDVYALYVVLCFV